MAEIDIVEEPGRVIFRTGSVIRYASIAAIIVLWLLTLMLWFVVTGFAWRVLLGTWTVLLASSSSPRNIRAWLAPKVLLEYLRNEQRLITHDETGVCISASNVKCLIAYQYSQVGDTWHRLIAVLADGTPINLLDHVSSGSSLDEVMWAIANLLQTRELRLPDQPTRDGPLVSRSGDWYINEELLARSLED